MSNFPNNWRLLPFEDCMEAIIDYRGKTPEKSSFGVPLVTAKVVKDGRINFEANPEYIPFENYDAWMRRGLPKPGDIVMTMEAPLGEVAQLNDQKVALGQRLITLRGKSNLLDNTYLKYMMISRFVQEQIQARGSGTTVIGIKQSELRKITLVIPPLPTQRRIAEILGRLDDKIEGNRRTNRTLEAMAQALFKHHFVAFEPYQEALVESKLGLIPRGWEVAPLSSHIKVAKGLSYKGQWLASEGMPLHNLNSIYEGGGYKYEGIKFYVGEYQPRHTIRPGDLIIANTEQGFDYLLIGCPAIVPKRFGEMGLFTHHIYKVELLPGSPLTTHYLYFWVKNPQLRQAVTAFTNGTTVNMLSRDGLQIPLTVIPPSEIVQGFDRVVSNVARQIEHNEDENVKLAEIRDYLLPKLLSGEIGV